MDMKELFENGCFTPAWTEREEVPEPVKDEIVPQRKDVTVLLDELADIKDNMNSIKERLWYIHRAREYNEAGFNKE
ncbi:MAG: hypothetical protein K6E29_07805 [Cyanobacteria bacterium RUI128]|nr:hypothetical protein [Cyanobacteria bacterium RUI128]